MRRSEVDLALIERVLDLVGEDAGGETRDELLRLVLVRRVQDVVVDQDVLAEEGELEMVMMMRCWTGRRWRRVGTLYFMFLKRPPTGKISICWVEGDCGRTKGSEMDDMGGLVLVVQRLRLRGVSEVLMGPMHSVIHSGHIP